MNIPDDRPNDPVVIAGKDCHLCRRALPLTMYFKARDRKSFIRDECRDCSRLINTTYRYYRRHNYSDKVVSRAYRKAVELCKAREWSYRIRGRWATATKKQMTMVRAPYV